MDVPFLRMRLRVHGRARPAVLERVFAGADGCPN
jgi:hypothetical protein